MECITNGFKDVDIESDSVFIINMINDHNKTSYHIMQPIYQISKLKRQGSFKFQHYYGETNSLADLLANLDEILSSLRIRLQFTHPPNFHFFLIKGFLLFEEESTLTCTEMQDWFLGD